MSINRLNFASISSKRATSVIFEDYTRPPDLPNTFVLSRSSSGSSLQSPLSLGTMAKSKMASTTGAKWYFEPTAEEIEALATLGDYEKLLISKLVHTLRLGVYFYQRQHTTDAQVSIKSTTPAAKACQKFSFAALKNCMESDKLFPLRLTAPSMHLITEILPLDTPPSTMLVFKVCVLRTFGVGSLDAINDLAKSLSTTDPEPDLKNLDTVIQGVGKGKDKMPRLVYGNLQIVRASVPEMLEKFWAFAKEITKEDKSTTLPTFEAIQTILCNASIPTVKRQGLLAWLITSDLAEWNICKAPEIEDLDAHMPTKKDKKAAPSGPTKALKRVEAEHKKLYGDEEGGYVRPDPSEALTNVWRVLANPPVGAAWLEELVEECRKAQGRALSVVDLEHLLCKIDRYGGKSG
ncbi:uncharacterized protein PAC_19569 [Phialocephala subalpina]|uniref:Uncharacterized protein n=1 Tax=Phialocephala subalpina TaxID=576137 RepID=A0A1L7XXF5_9HELO|nr:uncharacterized protein PAC_19569 [Phialocephala subalpina]